MIQTTLALLVLALPPQVEITGKGTKIIQGQITITVLPDGSVLVKSPSANLVLPAADAEPVVPPADDLADALRAIYGADQDTAKKTKLALLIKSYQAALESLDKVSTVADFAQALSKSQSLKAADLRPLRDRLAQEIQVTLGTGAAAWLAGQGDRVAHCAKFLGQELGLRRFSGTVDALETDEDALPCRHGVLLGRLLLALVLVDGPIVLLQAGAEGAARG